MKCSLVTKLRCWLMEIKFQRPNPFKHTHFIPHFTPNFSPPNAPISPYKPTHHSTQPTTILGPKPAPF